MSDFDFRTRVLLPLVCLAGVLLAEGRAQAQQVSCKGKPKSCDFQEHSTLLRSQLWGGECQPSRWNTLPPQAFPMEEHDKKPALQLGPRAPVHFLNGICEAHKEKDANLDRGISELQKAQTQGLMPSQRNLAALFEGQLHCRALSELRAKAGGTLTQESSSRDLFCLHRGMAKASFTQVDWTNLELRYEGDATFSLDTHAEKMAQCYGDFLHAGFDATCGLLTTPSPGTVKQAVEKSANDVLTSYFGNATGAPSSEDTGVSPLKAMLARKLEMADASLQGSTALQAGVEEKNRLLTGSYRGLASLYCNEKAEGVPCAGPLPTGITQLAKAYEAAVHKAQDILSFVNGWTNGLFQVNGVDVRKQLEAGSEALSGVLKRVEAPGGPGKPSLLEALGRVKGDMVVLADSGSAERKTVLSLCGIYFCEVRNRDKDFFQRVCNQADARTGKKLSESNALCAAEPGKTFLSEEQRASAFGVCQGAGFPESLMTKRLKASEVDACMTQFHPD